MNLVKRLDKREQKTSFDDSGCMNGDSIKIVLKKDVIPYSVTTAMGVPFLILPKVTEELNRLENRGIIENVTESTDKCAFIISVIK